MPRMRHKFADRSDIRTAENRRKRGEVMQHQRDVNTGLRSLLPGREISGLTGSSWPGGMERYQHASHPLNEASAWPALGSDRMDNSLGVNKWGMTGGPNLSGNFPMYATWTGGEGLTGSQGYGRDNYNPLQYKWGYPTDMLEVEDHFAIADQRENFPYGEFSGTEFPPRPLDYDADEFAGTPVQRYQPAEGTEYNPMEHIDYDALHMMNPSGVGEFANTPNLAQQIDPRQMLGLPPTEQPEQGMWLKILERAKQLGVLPFGSVGKAYGALYPTGYSRGGIVSLVR